MKLSVTRQTKPFHNLYMFHHHTTTHHPLEVPPQQDRRILYPPHEVDPKGPCSRNLSEASRGRVGVSHGFMLDETTIKTGAFKVVKGIIGRQSTLGMAEFPCVIETELEVVAPAIVFGRGGAGGAGERRYRGRCAFLVIPRVMGTPLSVRVEPQKLIDFANTCLFCRDLSLRGHVARILQ